MWPLWEMVKQHQLKLDAGRPDGTPLGPPPKRGLCPSKGVNEDAHSTPVWDRHGWKQPDRPPRSPQRKPHRQRVCGFLGTSGELLALN